MSTTHPDAGFRVVEFSYDRSGVQTDHRLVPAVFATDAEALAYARAHCARGWHILDNRHIKAAP